MTRPAPTYYRVVMSETRRDPRREIIEMGSRIAVEVSDGNSVRSVPVNVFDPAAPPFRGNSPVAAVCNSIKREVMESQPLPSTPSIATPSRVPEISKGIEKTGPSMPQISR